MIWAGALTSMIMIYSYLYFSTFKQLKNAKKKQSVTGPTVRQTDRPTDRLTDRPTDTVTYALAATKTQTIFFTKSFQV